MTRVNNCLHHQGSQVPGQQVMNLTPCILDTWGQHGDLFLTSSMNSDGEWMMDLTWFNWGPTCRIALLLRLFERQLELLVGIQWHSVFLFVSDAGCTEDLEESCRTRSRPPNPMTSRPLRCLLHCKVKLFQLQRLHLHVFLHQLLQWHPKWGSICHDRNDLELLIGTTTQFANCKHQYWPTLLSTLKLRLHQSPKQPFPRPDLCFQEDCLFGRQPSTHMPVSTLLENVFFFYFACILC